jgi:hypothetical protein
MGKGMSRCLEQDPGIVNDISGRRPDKRKLREVKDMRSESES